MRWRDRVPVLIGAAIGLAISGYALVYAPMSKNYAECGRVTLCASASEAATAGETENTGLAEGESAVGESRDAQRPTS